METDRIDDAILRELNLDARISNIELAKLIGLSPSACLRRVQRMEQAGIIKGYRAVINPVSRGVAFVAFVTVGLSEHTKKAQLAFESAIRLAPQVRECHNVTGAFEYILRVESRDLESYKAFHTDVLGTIPHVHSIQTYVVMGSPKDERA